VRSLRAGERVLKSSARVITRRLKLVVNEANSAVARPWERQLLGVSVTRHRAPTRRIGPQAGQRFKQRIRTLTQRPRGQRLETRGFSRRTATCEAATAPAAFVKHPRCLASLPHGFAADYAALWGSSGAGQAIGHDAAAASAESSPGTPPNLHTDPGVSVRARR
jgi:hypothetical protein